MCLNISRGKENCKFQTQNIKFISILPVKQVQIFRLCVFRMLKRKIENVQLVCRSSLVASIRHNSNYGKFQTVYDEPSVI
jgi:hypothetical protein